MHSKYIAKYMCYNGNKNSKCILCFRESKIIRTMLLKLAVACKRKLNLSLLNLPDIEIFVIIQMFLLIYEYRKLKLMLLDMH